MGLSEGGSEWSTMHTRDREKTITQLIFSGSATAEDVEKLLDEGMSPDQKLEMGAPVLQIAANRGKVDIVELLLKRGADVNLVFDHRGRALTALDSAMSPDAKNGPFREKIIELLQNNGGKRGAE